ncbi:MAG TPA: ABC transporter permease [Flavobacteriia bacterium]|nr:ABC transporter permease [Flavobacteriia bacterium]
MKKLKLIIEREFNAKVRNKAFIIMTFLTPFIVVGMIFLVAYLSKANDNSAKTIAVLDAEKLINNDVLKESETTKYVFLNPQSIEDARKLSEKENYYALLVIPKNDSLELLAKNIQFFTKKSPNMMMVESLEKKIENSLHSKKLKQLGLDKEKIEKAKIKTNFKLATYSGEHSSKLLNGIKIAFGSLGGYILMMFIIIYGNSVMRSVIEEKTNRIIEVIISSVKPFQLMMGKIIGNALAGLTQFLIWGIMVFILYSVVINFMGIEPNSISKPGGINADQMEMAQELSKSNDVMQIIQQLPIIKMGILFIIYFLGGYLLYSSLYAAIGAAVDSETDTQQFMMPVIMPLMLAVYVGAFSVISDPHGPVATIFSLIPFTSPIVMLMRVPFDPPLWQIILSIVLLIGMFVLTVWFASKIYRVGILMYGKKPTYKEIFKWLKY